jgi:hypothetical protein
MAKNISAIAGPFAAISVCSAGAPGILPARYATAPSQAACMSPRKVAEKLSKRWGQALYMAPNTPGGSTAAKPPSTRLKEQPSYLELCRSIRSSSYLRQRPCRASTIPSNTHRPQTSHLVQHHNPYNGGCQ